MGPRRFQDNPRVRGSALRADPRGGAAEHDADDDPWMVGHMPAFPVIEHGDRLTATDLLGWWFRPPRRAGWNSFFEEAEREGAPELQPATQPHPKARSEHGQRAFARSWTLVRSAIRDNETHLIDEQAEGALDCLYEFLHAIERRDLTSAMARVSEQFHTIESDREVTKADLRARVEQLFDWMGGWGAQVVLTTVPEPMFHPLGILIPVEIQVDSEGGGENDAPRTHLDERVALLQAEADGTWSIAGLSPARSQIVNAEEGHDESSDG